MNGIHLPVKDLRRSLLDFKMVPRYALMYDACNPKTEWVRLDETHLIHLYVTLNELLLFLYFWRQIFTKLEFYSLCAYHSRRWFLNLYPHTFLELLKGSSEHTIFLFHFVALGKGRLRGRLNCLRLTIFFPLALPF